MDTAAIARIAKARETIIDRAPWFGALSLRLKLVEQSSRECPTMAVDGVHLFYSVSFVMGVSEIELIGVVVHEVLHCAYRHFARRNGRNNELWNYATDYVINLDVVAAGFVLPDGMLYDTRYAGMTAEQVYALLERDARDGKPKPGDGKSQPGEVRDGPTQDDDGNAIEPGSVEAGWQDAVTVAAGVAKRRNAGKLPGSLGNLIATGSKPLVDWRDVLRRFTDQSAHRIDTWSRPNRRHAWRGVTLPTSIPDRPGLIVFCVDTSGSMDAAALSQCLAELQAALEDGACDTVAVIYADTRVHHVDVFEAGDTITPRAANGGGTDFDDAMAYATREYPDAACLVYLTDGGTSSWGREPSYPVLWALTLPEQWASQLAIPYGERLFLY